LKVKFKLSSHTEIAIVKQYIVAPKAWFIKQQLGYELHNLEIG